MRTRQPALNLYRIDLCLAAAILIAIFAGSAASQIRRPSVIVQVLDEQGRTIAGARATLTDAANQERAVLTNGGGEVAFSDLPSGSYALRVEAENFRTYEDKRVQVISGPDLNLKVRLRIAVVEANIAVFPERSVAQDAEYIGGSLVIRGEVLAALEGAGGMEPLLRALALRTSGPFGPVALVNGFEDSQLPPIFSIREIRINDNPFSAEYGSLGLGRIEILTKPGTETLHAMAFGHLGDARFNSRNPFAENKIPYQSRIYGGNISGPLWRNRATFFIDLNRQQINTNAVINASVVESGSIVSLRQAVVTPHLRQSFSPRLDLQLGASHTVVLKYGDTRSEAANSGIGGFSLLSRAQSSDGRVRTYQVTDTTVLGAQTINETRAQHIRTNTSRYGDNLTPTINVPGAFIGGGSEIGQAYARQRLSELQNVTSHQTENHVLKIGLQGRYLDEVDGSTQNFGGAYRFSSRIAPQLNESNNVISDANGSPVMVPITTIEAYRRTLLFRARGLSPASVRLLGGGASQFSIAAGEIETPVKQYQWSGFIEDNWRLHPRFTLSSGIRYERVQHVSRYLDFAPRLAFAWGIGGAQANRLVLRGGVGVFYDRIGERVVLRSRQMDGVRQRQYFTSDTSILDLFPARPPQSALAGFAVPQSTVRLASDLRSPYTMNSSIALETQLLPGLSIAITGSRLRSLHLLRSRNVNAPLPGSITALSPRGLRPFGHSADVFQYESSGEFRQRQMMLNLVYRESNDFTLWSTYTLGSSKGDTESPDSFPADGYDLRGEYARSALHARHMLYLGGWIRAPGGLELSPLVLWRSSIPFDITTGFDANGDSLFTDRPGFATDANRPSVVETRFGAFDLAPGPGQRIIPRNFGNSPDFLIANLRVGRKFSLGGRASVMLAVQGTNILNRTNPGAPVGTLGSPLFGRSNSSAGDWGFGSNQAGNRRLETVLYFMF